MKLNLVLALIVSALALAGCGDLGLGGMQFTYGELGTGHKLDVQHEADSTAPLLVAVLLQDVDTHQLLRQELVNLAPGQEVVLLDVPAGAYEVVSLFSDGTRRPAPPEQPLRVYISPEADAAVSFRR